MSSLTLEQQAYDMSPIARIDALRTSTRRFPLSLLELGMRLAVGATFFRSGMNKFQSFDTAITLFREEYRLPLLPPALGAALAATGEHVLPLLLLFGLGTRFAALGLLGMTLVIQLLVYPGAYPTHGTWAALLLLLAARGGGVLSLDHWLARRVPAWTP